MIFCTFNACDISNLENENYLSLQNSDDIAVIDGTLHFKNFQVFNDWQYKFTEMEDNEIDRWEESIGFDSYRKIFSKSADEFHELKTQESFDDWKLKYDDILYMDGDIVTPKISNYSKQLITNRNGEYFIGQTYNKVLGNKVITILDGDKSKMDVAINLSTASIEKGINIHNLPKPDIMELRSLNTCNAEDNHAAASTQNGDRKAFISLTAELAKVDLVTNLYETVVGLRVYGHKKSLFGWNIYNTLLAYDQVSYQVRDHEGNLHTEYVPAHTNSSNSKNLRFTETYGAYIYPNSSTPDPYFEWLQGRGITSGVGDNYWAVICCNVLYCPSQSGNDPFP